MRRGCIFFCFPGEIVLVLGSTVFGSFVIFSVLDIWTGTWI